jgi:hypothetical protein
MRNERWVIYQLGYGKPYVVITVDEKPQHVSDGCYAVQQRRDGENWIDVEETKIEGEWFANEDRTVKCQLCFLQEHTDNKDLDGNVHEGFTIGKGKALYFLYVWHQSGNASVYSVKEGVHSGRYVKGDVDITIHFK